MSEWEINKPIGQCSGSGKTIESGDEYFGALVETKEGLQRRDFSAEFWQIKNRTFSATGKPNYRIPNRKNRYSSMTTC